MATNQFIKVSCNEGGKLHPGTKASVNSINKLSSADIR